MISQLGTLEISGSRLRSNLDLLRGKLPPEARICATIKADAYGHGMREIQALLATMGVDRHCTYTTGEAFRAQTNAEVERYPVTVLALCPAIQPAGAESGLATREIIASISLSRQLHITVVDCASAEFFNHIRGAARNGGPLPVHVQVDTGLTRAGVSVADATAVIDRILSLPHLRLAGIFTHLSHGDVAGHPSIQEQIEALHKIADPIKREHPEILIHAQNSGGAWNFSDAGLDMVRIGIAMYGLQPAVDEPIPGLLPIARLVAPILMIHERPANTGVGYGHTFVTRRESRLAIVPVGYADGYPRAMSNRGIVQVRGQDAPVVGRVSMDQIIVDVTDIVGATAGDQVTIFSNDPAARNCIDKIAKDCGTIGYEIATGLGSRLMRQIVD